MILVPVERYERMQRQLTQEQELPSVGTTGDEMTRIDAKMHKVLDSVNSKNEREKAIEFSQLLQKYLQKGKINSARRDDDDEDEENEDGVGERQRADINSIVRLMAKTYKNSARVLLNHFLDSGEVSWTENRHLVYKTQIYHHINIVDVLSDCIKRRKPESRGVNFFVAILKQINTPLALINNPDIRERLSRANLSQSPSRFGSPKLSSTPRPFNYSMTEDETETTLENSKNESWSKLR